MITSPSASASRQPLTALVGRLHGTQSALEGGGSDTFARLHRAVLRHRGSGQKLHDHDAMLPQSGSGTASLGAPRDRSRFLEWVTPKMVNRHSFCMCRKLGLEIDEASTMRQSLCASGKACVASCRRSAATWCQEAARTVWVRPETGPGPSTGTGLAAGADVSMSALFVNSL